MTGNENYVQYDNPNKRRSWGLRYYASTATADRIAVVNFVGSAWSRERNHLLNLSLNIIHEIEPNSERKTFPLLLQTYVNYPFAW